MNFTARAPLVIFSGLVAWLLVACASMERVLTPDDAQIRERIESIRSAIMAKEVEGIFRWGTPDWKFRAADGKTYDRAAYRERTTKLFTQIEIESLTTKVTHVDLQGVRAQVRLNQEMVRREVDAGGKATRWRVTYPEEQEWVKVADGWRVVRVSVFMVKREPVAAP